LSNGRARATLPRCPSSSTSYPTTENTERCRSRARPTSSVSTSTTKKIVELTRDLPTFASEVRKKKSKAKDEYPAEFEDSDEENENYVIRATDCLLLAGKIEEDNASLEVYVYEEKEFNLYAHHDIMLSSFPVALEWLCCDFSSVESAEVPRANMAIVGMMTPEIEIWNLDLMEPVEPTQVLSGKNAHTDAVTALALHPVRNNLLASASADRSLKIWDFTTMLPVFSCVDYKEAVQGVQWSQENESVIFSYSGDNRLKIFDARSKDSATNIACGFSIESFTTSAVFPDLIFLGSEDGSIHIFDIKKGKLPKSAAFANVHTKAIPSLTTNKQGHLISNSLDSVIKVFDIKTQTLLVQQVTTAGSLFGSSVCPDNDLLFACGSSIGEVVVWDYIFDLKAKSN